MKIDIDKIRSKLSDAHTEIVSIISIATEVDALRRLKLKEAGHKVCGLLQQALSLLPPPCKTCEGHKGWWECPECKARICWLDFDPKEIVTRCIRCHTDLEKFITVPCPICQAPVEEKAEVETDYLCGFTTNDPCQALQEKGE